MTSARRCASVLVLVLLTTLGLGAAAHAASGPVVNTSSGRLQGVRNAQVREFLGVRYAWPPVGALRWAPPRPVKRASRVVHATRAGSPCPQGGGGGGGATSLTLQSRSEDCLFLNVTTPAHMTRGARLPVMVWSHGGGYTSGAGAQYSAQRLADQGRVIVVTLNYRLGVFGYLDLPGMRGGGDFGLLDMVQALRWVKTNATVFGESSGAMQTCALLTSPAARGLFEKLAGESGGACNLNWPNDGLLPKVPAQTPYVPAKTNQALSLGVAKQLGCSGRQAIACMRKLPVIKLLPLMTSFSNVLAYRTPLLPRDPAVAVRTGHFRHVPVLMSGNRNEENSFVAGGVEALPNYYTDATYPKLLLTAFKHHAAAVAQRYPLSHYGSAAGAFASLITDDGWACASLAGDRALARHTRVYAAEFNDPRSPNVSRVHAPGVPQTSAHATDLPYLFDLGGRSLLSNPASHSLARTMVAYWTSFARTGHPVAPGEPKWPRLTPASSVVQGLDASGIKRIDLGDEHQCAFWRTVNPQDR